MIQLVGASRNTFLFETLKMTLDICVSQFITHENNNMYNKSVKHIYKFLSKTKIKQIHFPKVVSIASIVINVMLSITVKQVEI